MKIILLGNAGAGKSTMAKWLIGEAAIAYLSLDDIAWNADVRRKPLNESIALLHTFIRQHDEWLIEGCYGDLIEATLSDCDELHFLNPGVDACVVHCRQRPWEPDKFPSPTAQAAMLQNLINWVKTYEDRTDEFGLQRHRQIFAAFSGQKYEYRNASDYDRRLNH